MNRPLLLGSLLAVVSLATLWGVWSQRSQVAALRAEQQQLVTQLAARAEAPASYATAKPSAAGAATPPTNLAATPELLRLRSDVTRLTERRRELEGVRPDNARLRAQLASRGTNGPGGLHLPPGYIRKTEARLVGYNTPEDTMQSLLWALQNRDLTNVLQAFAPERAEAFRAHAAESGQSPEEFFKQAAGFVGMRIVKREQDAADGSITAEVEMIPGMPGQQFTFRQFNGQWKIDEPF